MKRLFARLVRLAIGVVAVLSLLLLALFVAGKRRGAGHNEAAIDVARPAADVFVYFTDLERAKLWVGGLTEATRLPDGHRRLTVMVDGERTDLDEDWATLEPSPRIVMKLRPPLDQPQTFIERADWTFAEHGGVTTVRVSADTQYHGLFALLESLITKAAQKKIEEHDLPTLKRVVEAAAASPPRGP